MKILFIILIAFTINATIGFTPWKIADYNLTSYNCQNYSSDMGHRLEKYFNVRVVSGIHNQKIHSWIAVNGIQVEPQNTHIIMPYEDYHPLFSLNLEDFDNKRYNGTSIIDLKSINWEYDSDV